MGPVTRWALWCINGMIKILGDIKIFPWPMFVVYDPSSYRVKGTDMRQVIGCAKPGDILLRGYKNYLDGYFIPGYFSHAGLYVGKVRPEDSGHVSVGAKSLFRAGDQMVIHSMAEGVFMEDLLDFCRCDHMMILRFPDEIKKCGETSLPDSELAEFTKEEKELFGQLQEGKTVSYEAIFPAIFKLALGRVGSPYDFQFNFSNYNNLSCTEFVYFCIKSLEPFHHLRPAKKRFLVFQKEVLTPDAFVASPFVPAWQSRSVDAREIEKIKKG